MKQSFWKIQQQILYIMLRNGFQQVKTIRNTPMLSPSPDYMTKSRNKLTTVTTQNLMHPQKKPQLLTPPKPSKFPSISPMLSSKKKDGQNQIPQTKTPSKMANLRQPISPHRRHLTVTINKKNNNQKLQNQFPSHNSVQKKPQYQNSINNIVQSQQIDLDQPPKKNQTIYNNTTNNQQYSPSKHQKHFITVISKQDYRQPLHSLQNQVQQIYKIVTDRQHLKTNQLQQQQGQYVHKVSNRIFQLLAEIRQNIESMKKQQEKRYSLSYSSEQGWQKTEEQFQTFGNKDIENNSKMGHSNSEEEKCIISLFEVSELQKQNNKLRRQVAQLKIQLHNLIENNEYVNLSKSSLIGEQSQIDASGIHIKKFAPSPQKTHVAESRFTIGTSSILKQNSNFYKEKNQYLEEEIQLNKNRHELMMKEKNQQINRLKQKLQLANNYIEKEMEYYKKIIEQQKQQMSQMKDQINQMSEKLNNRSSKKSTNLDMGEGKSLKKGNKKGVGLQIGKQFSFQGDEMDKQCARTQKSYSLYHELDTPRCGSHSAQKDKGQIYTITSKYQNILSKKDAEYSRKLLALLTQLKKIKESITQQDPAYHSICQICTHFKQGICQQCLLLKEEIYKKDVQIVQLKQKTQELQRIIEASKGKQLSENRSTSQRKRFIRQGKEMSPSKNNKLEQQIEMEENSENNTSQKSRVGKNRRGKFQKKKAQPISASTIIKTSQIDRKSLQKLGKSGIDSVRYHK